MKKTYLTIVIIIVVGVLLFAGFNLINKQEEVVVTDPLLQEIKNRGKLLVATDATYYPMESIDEDGNFIGLDIDIIKEIASDIGVEVEIYHIDWDRLISFDPLYEKEVDVLISSITITPERAQKVAFSDPYINAGQIIITTVEKADEIKSSDDLIGKKLGSQTKTTGEDVAREIAGDELVKGYEDIYYAVDALLDGEIDAVLCDYTVALSLVHNREELITVGDPFTQEFYGIAVIKENKELLKEINDSIRRMKRENIIDDLTREWFVN